MDYAHRSDQELVKLTLQNQEWFLGIVRRYEAKLTRYIRRLSNFNEQEIEDILQEIFIKVYRNLRDYEQNLKFSSWIYRIAHNEIITHYRQNQSRPHLIGGDDGEKIFSLLRDNNNHENDMDQKISREKINSVLNQIKKKYSEVLVLRYLEDLDYQEISDVLKIPVSTVGTQLKRAKKIFKEITLDQKILF